MGDLPPHIIPERKKRVNKLTTQLAAASICLSPDALPTQNHTDWSEANQTKRHGDLKMKKSDEFLAVTKIMCIFAHKKNGIWTATAL